MELGSGIELPLPVLLLYKGGTMPGGHISSPTFIASVGVCLSRKMGQAQQCPTGGMLQQHGLLEYFLLLPLPL